jgi:vanillate monooxygenase ferredoxin subunit
MIAAARAGQLDHRGQGGQVVADDDHVGAGDGQVRADAHRGPDPGGGQRRRPADLRFETFGSSGRFAPEAFTVRIPRLGVETLVPHDVSMLEALEACGADMMFDCRRGECGLCEVKVLDVDGVIDHRDVFLSDEQHRAGDRLQCCVSRVVSARTGGLSGADGRPGVVTIDVP